MLGLLNFRKLLDVKPPVKAELGDVRVPHLGRYLSLLLKFQSVGNVVPGYKILTLTLPKEK